MGKKAGRDRGTDRALSALQDQSRLGAEIAAKLELAYNVSPEDFKMLSAEWQEQGYNKQFIVYVTA